jgi:hypothetical protein
MFFYWGLKLPFLLPESVMLQGGSFQKGVASTWTLDTQFVILSQKIILGHIEVEVKKVY